MKPHLSGATIAAVFLLAAGGLSQASESKRVDLPAGDPFRITTGSSFSASGGTSNGESRRDPTAALVSDIDQALSIIESRSASFAGNRDELLGNAILSMLKSLDPHSSYYTRDQFNEMLGEHESEYVGTGLSIVGYVRNGLRETYVVGTAAGSPSESAGLKFGDRIISVDGKNATDEDPTTVRDLIRGPNGSRVKLVVERLRDGRSVPIVLSREPVPQRTVPLFFVSTDGVGYIDMTVGFSYSTYTELETALSTLRANRARSIVLDLRGNSGGIVDQAVAVAEAFLPAGRKILTQKGRRPHEDRTWISEDLTPENLPLVVLVDRETASAAEIVAAAFQDNDRAVIVGERTFGKGLVQSVLELPDGSGLALTSARYYTPSGRTIQRDYSDIGLYDYFRQTNSADLIDTSSFAARTLTARTVFGGNGIKPDVEIDGLRTKASRFDLLDPIFFFARDAVAGRITDIPAANELRQRAIFGSPVISEEEVERFISYLKGSKEWRALAVVGDEDRKFVLEQLRFQVDLAVFGAEAARRAQIENDEAFRRASGEVATARRLADAANIAAKRAAK